MTQHIDDTLMMGYAAGTLPEALNLVVATQVSVSESAKERLHSFEALGGALLDEMEDVAISSDSFAATLALLSQSPSQQAAPRSQTCSVLPQPLRDYVGGGLADVKWRSVGLGVKQAILPVEDNGPTARLLKIPAGQAMPDHGHNGMEVTLVLQGAYIDDGVRFARGDMEVADEDLEHMPVADIGEDCICLVVMDAPLRFNGLLPKIAQTFLRI